MAEHKGGSLNPPPRLLVEDNGARHPLRESGGGLGMVFSLAKHLPRFRGNDSCTASFVLLEPLKQEAGNKGRNSVFCLLYSGWQDSARFCSTWPAL